MGVSRLLAKGWVAFCLFAGAHALANGLHAGMPFLETFGEVGVCVLLFLAMGLLFIGGFGTAGTPGGLPRLTPSHFIPGFNELVFILFALASLTVQLAFEHNPLSGAGLLGALEAALRFTVPGQRELEYSLTYCSLDGGRAFASSFTWLLALIFVASAISRVRLAAGIVRIERKTNPDSLGPTALALALGVMAILGIQFLFIGSAYMLMPCPWLSGLFGSVLIGFGPLALAYGFVAALTNLIALGPDA